MPAGSSTRTVVIAAIIVVFAFVAGVFTGIFADHVIRIRRGERHIPPFASHVMLERLDRRLDLTDDQRTKIEAIMTRHHERIEQLMENHRPLVRKELEAANAEIEAVLTPQQREKFQKIRMRLGHPEGTRRRGPTR